MPELPYDPDFVIEALRARITELETGIQAALNLFHDDTIDGPETLEEMAVILCALKPK